MLVKILVGSLGDWAPPIVIIGNKRSVTGTNTHGKRPCHAPYYCGGGLLKYKFINLKLLIKFHLSPIHAYMCIDIVAMTTRVYVFYIHIPRVTNVKVLRVTEKLKSLYSSNSVKKQKNIFYSILS